MKDRFKKDKNLKSCQKIFSMFARNKDDNIHRSKVGQTDISFKYLNRDLSSDYRVVMLSWVYLIITGIIIQKNDYKNLSMLRLKIRSILCGRTYQRT